MSAAARSARPLLLLVLLLSGSTTGGCPAASTPDWAIDLQGFRELEPVAGGGHARVFRREEDLIVLVEPGVAGAVDGTELRLVGWLAAGPPEVPAAPSPGGQPLFTLGLDTESGLEAVVNEDGSMRLGLAPDALGDATDQPVTVVVAGWTGPRRSLRRRALRHAEQGSLPDPVPAGMILAAIPVQIEPADRGAGEGGPELARCIEATRSREADAATRCIEALATHEADGDPRGQARALFELGRLDRRAGRLEDARGHYQAAAEAAGRADLPASRTRSLRLAAHACDEAGHYAAGRRYALDALAIDEEVGHQRWVARDRFYLGTFAHKLGEPSQALDQLRRSLALSRRLGQDYDEANALIMLGYVYQDLGRYTAALEILEQARPLVEPPPDAAEHQLDAWGTWLTDKGYCQLRARRRGLVAVDADEVRSAFEQALEIHQGEDLRLWQANDLMNLAELELQEGRLDHARAQLRRAEELVGPEASFEHAAWTLSLHGEMALIEGDEQATLAAFDRLLELEQDPAARWWALYGRARALELGGHGDRARVEYLAALDALEERAASLDPIIDRPYFLGDREEVYGRLVLHLLDRGDTAAAFSTAERSRGRSTLGEHPQRGDSPPGAAGPWEQVSVTRLQLRSHEEEEAFVTPGQRARWEQEHAALVRNVLDAEAAWAGWLESQGGTRVQPIPDLPEVIGALPADAILLYYLVLPGELVLIAGGGAGFEVHRQPLVPGTLMARVERHRGASMGDDEPHRALAALLLPDGLDLDPETLLYVVPHGILHDVSFPSLSRDGRYLVQDHALVVNPSAAAVVRAARTSAPPASGRALVIADPTGDLPQARAEGEEVAALWSDATLLLDREATAEAVWAALPEASMVHYAGHAVHDRDAPALSHLQLGGGDRITLFDLVSSSLSAGVVVLSGCETGRSQTPAAGNPLGLSTALLDAGAGSVVASSWRVREQAAGALMVRFHTALSALGPAAALRQAQLALLEGQEGESNTSPGSWGVFQLYGAP